MSGFAGSDRAGGRRRRMVAVEVEGVESPVSQGLGTGETSERSAAMTGKEAVGLSPRDCPIINVIPPQAWKHWAMAALALTVGVLFLVAGHTHTEWAGNLGPGVPRLLKVAASPVVAWANSLILFLAAQAACLILWARSRSLKDFDGRYRIWGWAAATWVLLSFSIATQAHQAWSETILHRFPWRAPGAAMWCWMVPATLWGAGLAMRIEQDMREDRHGYWVFLFACLCHFATAGLVCQQEVGPQYLSPVLSRVVLTAVGCLGHLMLLLSMTLHTRHVLYFTAEPPPGKRRVKRGQAVPASGNLFQRFLPGWMTGVKMPGEGIEDSTEDDDSYRARKRAAPKKKSTARKTTRLSKESAASAEELAPGKVVAKDLAIEPQLVAGGADKKNYRIDKA